MGRIIIGFSGAMGSGKDTAALIAAHGFAHLNFKQISFAEAIKKAYEVMTGISWKEGSREFKESICPVFKMARREVLQKIGTNALRNNFDKDIWINILAHKYPDGNLLISDVRFDNEAQWIRKNGGFIIEVVRTGETEKSIYANHESENGVKGDFVIENDFLPGGFELFRQKIVDTVISAVGVQETPDDVFDLVELWMQEFNIFDAYHKNHAIALYVDLLKEEVSELSKESLNLSEDQSVRRFSEELCDVLWVTTALCALTMGREKTAQAMKKLFKANMSKATNDSAAIKEYCNHNAAIVNRTKSGRYFAKSLITDKIKKGPMYELFDLEGIVD